MKKNIIAVIFLFAGLPLYADWSFGSSIGMYSSADSAASNIYYLDPGLRYADKSWNLSAYLQILGMGNISSPIGGNGSGMMSSGSSGASIGLGDFYLYPEYYLLTDSTGSPVLTVSGSLKIPVESSSSGYGTGNFDEGLSLNYYNGIGDFLILANLGLIQYGGSINEAPVLIITYGIGLGKFFGNGKYSFMLYWGADTQHQNFSQTNNELSFGFNCRTGKSLILSAIVSAGISEKIDYRGLSIGINYEISNNYEEYQK